MKDLEFMMNWSVDAKPVAKQNRHDLESYGESERSIMSTLLEHGGMLLIDELSWKTNLPIGQLASLLLELEFRGAIQSLPGKKYKVASA